jgi:hypothetical protein
MNHKIDLTPHIGSEKTLIISGAEAIAETYDTFVNNVFVYTIPQGILVRYDAQQHEMLLRHVCEKACSQIIYLGPSRLSVPEHLDNNDSPRSLHLALKFNLSVLLRKHKDDAIKPHIRRQMLLDLYVIEQCKLLMDYYFIRKKVKMAHLTVKGIVPDLNTGNFKSIFLNGISYNDLITLN